MRRLNIAFIGFGEAARAFVTGWNGVVSAELAAFDIKTNFPGGRRQEKHADYEMSGVSGCDTAAAAVESADAVFSLVTADQARAAASSVAPHLRPGALFLDCNSCAPQTKQDASRRIAERGAHYVDVAIMAPVHPRLHQTPILVSGPQAPDALAVMERLDMVAKQVSGEIGTASSIKLVRSIVVKGLEALSAEFLLAGRKLGVEDIVLETLEDTFPGFEWNRRAGQMLGRMVQHGERRAAEMQEAALMIEKLGLPNRMAEATAAWQQQIGGHGLAPGLEDYRSRADTLIDTL